MNLAILNNLKNPARLIMAFAVAIIFFDFNYFLMSKLPGSKDLMCVIGANLTPLNIAFAVVLSLFAGIIVAGIIELFKQKKPKAKSSSLSGIGIVLGSVTVFCLPCTFAVFTVFGVAISLNFFMIYDLYIKLASLLLMIYGTYLLNKQLAGECAMCKT